MAREPFFLDTPGGRIFAVAHRGGSAARGLLLMCPPFAEEAKAAARIFSDLGERAAAEGVLSLALDYLGSGDSEGASETFTLEGAVRDAAAGIGWLRRQGEAPLRVLGLRLGAAIAWRAGRDPGVAGLLLWAPVLSGAAYLREILYREKVRAAMTEGNGERGSRDSEAHESGAGETVDLSGQLYSRRLLEEIEAAALDAAPRPDLPVAAFWINPGGSAPPGGEPLRKALGVRLREEAVAGPPFWNRLGILKMDGLVERTVKALLE